MAKYRDTQITAWCDLQSSLDTRQDQVYQVIKSMGGAAGWEIARALGLPLHCVSGRINELCKEDYVEDSGERRVNPASGKRGIVWRPKK